MSWNLGISADAAGSAQIAHRSPISDPPTSIHRFPNELLAEVFEAGARTTFQDNRGNLPFIIVVSHVCRHWRTIAYSFPDAWCCIPVHLRRDAMTELFLSRSQGHLLDVCLYIVDSEFVLRAVTEAMKLISSSAPRWTRFRICAWSVVGLFLAYSDFRGLRDVGRLCAFELQIDRPPITWHALENEVHPSLPPPPKLNTVVCIGQSVGCTSKMIRGLTRLTLAHLPASRPSAADFCEMCMQNPRLEYLNLEDAFSTLVGYGSQAWGPFVLNSLHTLEVTMNLKDEDEAYVEIFFGALIAPALCKLSFQSKLQLAWKSFGNAINNWNGSLSPKHLRMLYLVVTGPVDFRQVAVSSNLFHTFPKLEHLSFHAFENQSVLYFLRGWIYGIHNGVMSPHAVWPQLKSLTVRMPHGDDKTVGQETVRDSLDLLEKLRLSNGQHFRLYVW